MIKVRVAIPAVPSWRAHTRLTRQFDKYGISTYQSGVPWLWRLRCLAGAAVTVREAPLVSVGSGCKDLDYRSGLQQTTCSLTGNCLWVNFSSRVKSCHGAQHRLILRKKHKYHNWLISYFYRIFSRIVLTPPPPPLSLIPSWDKWLIYFPLFL